MDNANNSSGILWEGRTTVCGQMVAASIRDTHFSSIICTAYPRNKIFAVPICFSSLGIQCTLAAMTTTFSISHKVYQLCIRLRRSSNLPVYVRKVPDTRLEDVKRGARNDWLPMTTVMIHEISFRRADEEVFPTQTVCGNSTCCTKQIFVFNLYSRWFI